MGRGYGKYANNDRNRFDEEPYLNAIDVNVSRYRDFLEQREKARKTIESRTEETKANIEKSIIAEQARQKEVQNLHAKVSVLKNELYNSLKEKVAATDVKTAIKECNDKLNDLKEISERLIDLTRRSRKKQGYEYNRLLERLAHDVDAAFILYANFDYPFDGPTAAFAVNKLSKEDKKILQSKLSKIGYFDLEKKTTFTSLILKYFPDHINVMNATEACFALGLDPSKFERINPSIQSFFLTNTSLLKEAVHKNPNVVKYLPNEFLDVLANDEPQALGQAIVKNPEILEDIYANYPSLFKKYYKDIKYMFTGIAKAKVIGAVSKYTSEFPEFEKYYRISPAEHKLD